MIKYVFLLTHYITVTVPKICILRFARSSLWEAKGFCMSRRNTMGYRLWPFSKDGRLGPLQGSCYETRGLPVSGERIQKKISTEREIYLYYSKRSIWVPLWNFPVRCSPKETLHRSPVLAPHHPRHRLQGKHQLSLILCSYRLAQWVLQKCPLSQRWIHQLKGRQKHPWELGKNI